MKWKYVFRVVFCYGLVGAVSSCASTEMLRAQKNAPIEATYITRTPDPTLPNETALSALPDGLLKIVGGMPTAAVPGVDYVVPGTQGEMTHVISPIDKGATCNGGTDDTQSLRETILLADTPPYKKIRLPPCRLDYSGVLVYGNQPTRYSSISMEGSGQYISVLQYTGPTTVLASIEIRHMSAYEWKGFTIQGPNNSPGSPGQGTTIGILVDGCAPTPCGSGTMNTLQVFRDLNWAGWKTGFQQGGVNSGSEVLCINCGMAYNDRGFISYTYNSLNFWFISVHLGGNNCGIAAPFEAPHVIGGDSWGSNVADFCINGFDTFTVQDFRAEIKPGGQFLAPLNPGWMTSAIIRSSIVLGTPTQTVISFRGNFLEINDRSSIVGRIDATLMDGGALRVINSHLAYVNGKPAILPATAGFGLIIEARHNSPPPSISSPECTDLANFCPDVFGILTNVWRDLPWKMPTTERVQLVNGTAAVSFVRSVGITTTAYSDIITFPVGSISGVDVDKEITILQAATSCGFGSNSPAPDNVRGYIHEMLTPTTARVAYGQGYSYAAHQCANRITASGSFQATIGTPTTRSDYAVALTSDNWDAVRVVNRTSTGFTISSNNPTSVAVVDAVVGR